jgi:hypothetical protein
MTAQERDEIVGLLHDEHYFSWEDAEWWVDEEEDAIDDMYYAGRFAEDIAYILASRYRGSHR